MRKSNSESHHSIFLYLFLIGLLVPIFLLSDFFINPKNGGYLRDYQIKLDRENSIVIDEYGFEMGLNEQSTIELTKDHFLVVTPNSNSENDKIQ